MISGSCHCGAVHLEAARLPLRLNECQCSICRRYAVRWAYYPRRDVKIIAAPDATSMYQCSDRILEFHRCKVCGCVTHWQGAPGTDVSRLALNMRLFQPHELANVPIEVSQGPSD
jgi:hypothetical protein